MFFFTKGGIHCISQVFPWNFYFMREHSLVELTEHNDSAANIIVHFSNYRVCADFSGSFYFFLICVPFLGS